MVGGPPAEPQQGHLRIPLQDVVHECLPLVRTPLHDGQRPVRCEGQELLAVRPGLAERLRPRDLEDVAARV
eukprot:6453507-Pyramimonas_sp.AAC.1